MMTYMGSGEIFIATETNAIVFFMIYIDIGIVLFVSICNLIERHVTTNIFMTYQRLQFREEKNCCALFRSDNMP